MDPVVQPHVQNVHASPPDLDAAYRRTYREEIHYVCASLKRLGVATRDVEDAAHEVFVVAYKKFDQLDTSRSPRPWLFAIACRVASSHRRKRSTSSELLVEAEEGRVEADAERALMSRDRRALFERAVLAIAEERRPVFLLHEVEELPIPEVAKLLEIPLGTAYSRLRLAREDFGSAARRYGKEEQS